MRDDFENKTKELNDLIRLFSSTPELGDNHNSPLSHLEMLLSFSIQFSNIIEKVGILDANKLLQKGLMIIKRNHQDKILPLQSDI